jgi:hypothetical protein
MKKKLTLKERASKAGKARWAKVSKKERSRKGKENALKLWAKIRAGSLQANLTK